MVDLRSIIAEQLAPFAPYIRGNALASLVAIKGIPGSAELAGNPPFSGADGFALDKAFGRLNWGFGSQGTRVWLGIVLSALGYPELSPADLRLVLEIVDPLAIVVLDETARLKIIDAFESVDKALRTDFNSGTEHWILGRHVLSVEEFEQSLAQESLKQRAWGQLKRCQPPAIR